MLRTLLQAAAAGIAACVLLIAVFIAQGMYMTYTYVPDLSEAYESVDDLQHKTAFGGIASPSNGALIGPLAAAFLAGAVLFGGCKILYIKLKKRSMKMK